MVITKQLFFTFQCPINNMWCHATYSKKEVKFTSFGRFDLMDEELEYLKAHPEVLEQTKEWCKQHSKRIESVELANEYIKTLGIDSKFDEF